MSVVRLFHWTCDKCGKEVTKEGYGFPPGSAGHPGLPPGGPGSNPVGGIPPVTRQPDRNRKYTAGLRREQSIVLIPIHEENSRPRNQSTGKSIAGQDAVTIFFVTAFL